MNVGFCYNVKRNLPSTDPAAQADAEFDAPETIAAIKTALESGGHRVFSIEANDQCYLQLYKLRRKFDLIFNIAEGYYGTTREAQVPAICDMLRLPYTHSSALAHTVSLNKALTKKVLFYHDIATPQFQLFTSPHEPLHKELRFPILLKPNAEGSSKGILNANLVNNATKLRVRLKWLFQAYRESVLAEEFLSGREFTVAILGSPPKVLPIVEQNLNILPKKYQKFASYEVKWLWEDTLPNPHVAYTCPAKVTPSLKKKIEDICLSTFAALECRDAARIDLRLNSKGEPNILEINTLPGMIPGENIVSYFPIASRAAGIGYNEMVLTILEAACKRNGFNQAKSH